MNLSQKTKDKWKALTTHNIQKQAHQGTIYRPHYITQHIK